MSYIVFLLKHLLDLPKTIWINFKVLGLKQALRLPILISRKVRVVEIYKHSIVLPDKVKTFSIKIGIEGSVCVSHEQKGCIVLGKNSKIFFKGKAGLYEKALKSGLLIRDCSNYEGLTEGHYRIAIRSEEENERLITWLEKL